MRFSFVDKRLEAIAGRPAAIVLQPGVDSVLEAADRMEGLSTYILYSASGDTSLGWPTIANVATSTNLGRISLQGGSAGTPNISSRVDTLNGQTNRTLSLAGGLLAGVHTVSVVVTKGMTSASASLDSGGLVTGDLTPGQGIPRTIIGLASALMNYANPMMMLVYNQAHDLPTRRRIESYLRSLTRPQVTLPFKNAGGDQPTIETLPDGTVQFTTKTTGTTTLFWNPIPYDIRPGQQVTLRATVTGPADQMILRQTNWAYLSTMAPGMTNAERVTVNTPVGLGLAFPTVRISGKPIGTVVTLSPMIVDIFTPPTGVETSIGYGRVGATSGMALRPSERPTDPCTIYAVWPSGTKASERLTIQGNWIAMGRSGDGRAFAMRGREPSVNVILYGEALPEQEPVAMSAVADGQTLNLITIGPSGEPKTFSINCGPPYADPTTFSLSGGGTNGPVTHFYRGIHSREKRIAIMKSLAESRGGWVIP
ncbi:hypothetical protein SEA_REYNAULD_42 [Rhodococcus phage Reynauld]|uniref:Uncharacterized protein n=1 Tax=Rhodococcus phage Reynauld TaxID=3062845 RepID=A0ACD4UHJ2_9CAUD|nr:hypothetical protein SEA_REYNAULD_42 [Rhodococcus phage Reynauld]